jgi:hypothetical protein
MNRSLLDYQATILLTFLFFTYLVFLHESMNRKHYFIKFCYDSFAVSQSVNLTLFSCSLFFVVFSAQQMFQLMNFTSIGEVESAVPLAKINFSNIFVCLVCSTMFYKCFIEEQHYICRDAIGYVFFFFFFK